MADIVAVQNEGMPAIGEEPLLQRIGDGRFAGARQACEPEHRRALAFLFGEGIPADVERLPMDVGRAPQGKVDQTEGDSVVRLAVDQDEAAGFAVILVGIKRERLVQ